MRTGHCPVVLATAAALAVAAGCDSSAKGFGTALRSRSPASGSASTTSSTPSPSASPAPSAPSAADGANGAACADGRCEVTVPAGTAIPLPRSMNVEKVEVTAVTSTRATVTGHYLGNSSNASCTGNCYAYSSDDAFRFVLGADSLATANGLSLTVEHITNGTATLRSPRRNEPRSAPDVLDHQELQARYDRRYATATPR